LPSTRLISSRNALRLFGWASSALVGRNAYELFHPDDVERITADHARHTDGRDTPGIVQYRLRCADGHYAWVETRSEPHHVGGVLHRIVCITRDIHLEREQRERAEHAERALVRASRLAQTGDLARAVGHEINGLHPTLPRALDAAFGGKARTVTLGTRLLMTERIRTIVGAPNAAVRPQRAKTGSDAPLTNGAS
jgi:PAS domain S-box-containing protein